MSHITCFYLIFLFSEQTNRLVTKFFPALSPNMLARVRENFPVGLSATSDLEDLGKYGALECTTGSSEGAQAVISKRLWNYLLQRAGLEDSQLKWRQLNTQQIATLAQEITNCCFAVDGKRNGFSLLEVYFSAFPLDNVIICFKNIQVEGCIGTNLLLVEALI